MHILIYVSIQAHMVSNLVDFARCIRAAIEEKRRHELDLEIDVIFDQLPPPSSCLPLPSPHAPAQGTCQEHHNAQEHHRVSTAAISISGIKIV